MTYQIEPNKLASSILARAHDCDYVRRMINQGQTEQALTVLTSMEALLIEASRVARDEVERVNWLERHRRVAEIMVNGKTSDCWHYGLTAASGVSLREALDLLRKF